MQLAGPAGVVNPLHYRGERFDAVVSQYYLRARTYDPAAGRFTRVDPFAGDLNDPRSLHKYFYAGADPINYVDPSGMSFSLGGLGISMAIGATLGGMLGGIDAALGGESILRGILLGAGVGALLGAGAYALPGFFASWWVLGGGVGLSIPGIIHSFLQGKNAQGYFRVFTGIAVPLALRNAAIARLLAASEAALIARLSALWNRVGLRSNSYAFEQEVTGAYVSQRIPLSSEVPPGHYLYVVDDKGRMWLAPLGAEVAGLEMNHSSLVAVGERVRAAGHLLVKADGSVNLNSRSGHFMADDPVLPAEEPAWFQAITETLLNAGLAPGHVSPAPGQLPP